MLTDEELERYARQIVLKEIGGAGQMRLRNATVLLIGAGGIGSPAIQYLAAAGLGQLIVYDDDEVSLSNLQRQTLFESEDIGCEKVVVACERVRSLNPHIRFHAAVERVSRGNADRVIGGAAPTVIIDGSDNFDTRLAIADAALALRIPLVSAAVGQFDGQLGVYRGWEDGKPCYRCLVGDSPERDEASCAETGVLGPVTGVLGSLAALEAIRAIVPFGDDPTGKLLLVDLVGWRFRTLSVPKDPGCSVCSHPLPSGERDRLA